MRKRGVLIDAEQLVQLYQRRGWSQQDLAAKSGLDVRTIAKVRQGKTCDARTLQRLSTALGVAPEVLFVDAWNRPLPHGSLHVARPNGGSEETAQGSAFCLEEVWKVVDLRTPRAWGGNAACGRVWERYRVRRLRSGGASLCFPYLTWGERIDCLRLPDTARWQRVPVQPGDIVHSNKQWELRWELPAGALGSVVELGPIELLFVDAFHGADQQWWQVRVAEPTEALVIEILFSAEQPCRSWQASWAAPGQRQFRACDESSAFGFPDGSGVAWHVRRPLAGAYYQLAWQW